MVKINPSKTPVKKGAKGTAPKGGVTKSTRKSTRIAHAVKFALPKYERYLIPPKFGSPASNRGGTFMEVTLGPTAADTTNYGSKPAKNTPSIMRRLLDDLPDYDWVAGHLLNDNFGGHGVAKNLTPLTGTANKNHSAIELKLKKFVIEA